MQSRISIILITGGSHCGKSTLAQRLHTATGWPIDHTDQLGRHPGRPWPEPLARNAEFFSNLSAPSIFEFLLVHYGNLAPRIEHRIEVARQAGDGVIIEGSALRPKQIAALGAEAAGLCLTAEPALLRTRIQTQSGYEARDTSHRKIIDAFIERSLRDNEALISDAAEHGVTCLNSADANGLSDWVASVTGKAGAAG